jgi:hypothetical protein
MSTRTRIIYASQSVIVNGYHLYRVQTLGSTTSFTSEDVFELGQQDIIDVVDDTPTVAITLETNDWGAIDTIATIAGISRTGFATTADDTNSNLTVVSGSSEISYYHGVALANFGAANQFTLWAPVQTEASLGTATDTIDQTMFMDDCYLTSMEFGYTTGGNSTENYAGETDDKTWYLNDGKFVSQEEWTFVGAETTVTLGLAGGTEQVVQLSDSSYGFLYTTDDGERGINFYDTGTSTWTVYAIDTDAATAAKASYNTATNVITLPTGITVATDDRLFVRYAANDYADATGNSTTQRANYFTPLVDGDTSRPEDVGALRQGQVEIYLVDPSSNPGTAYDLMLRLTSCTISATMNRETLTELGHLKPYDRPLTYPVEITTSVETTAAQLETFAKFSGKETEYDAATLDDISIYTLLAKDDLTLVVQLYQQTDEDAGGTASNRKVLQADMVGTEYFIRGVRAVYSALNPSSPEREYPLKTVIVPNLKVTEEGYNLSIGSNATQTFNFRSVNKLFVVKGYVDMGDLTVTPGFQLNT